MIATVARNAEWFRPIPYFYGHVRRHLLQIGERNGDEIGRVPLREAENLEGTDQATRDRVFSALRFLGSLALLMLSREHRRYYPLCWEAC